MSVSETVGETDKVIAARESGALEAQAVALVRQYGMVLMMAPPVKAFFKRLAVFLKWENLEKTL